jgi:uncharacterized RDD family membrane protein YckC
MVEQLASARRRTWQTVDRTLDVRTPESIAFSYELAGLGSRFLALMVDQVIQIAVLLAIFFGVVYTGARLAVRHAAPGAWHPLAQSIGVAVALFVVFVVLFGYFIVFEAVWNGQTPGKKLVGLRVVRDGGYPIDFGASLIRNLIRIGEWILGYYFLSAVCALLSAENKRIGDFAAGTIVVRDSRLAAPRNLAESPSTPSVSAAAHLTLDERALLERFLERRDSLGTGRRKELAAQLAAHFRPRAPDELARLDDESLLERL